MKKFIIATVLMFGLSSAWASIITDDFDRADTGITTDGSVIGPGWVNATGLDEWELETGAVYRRTNLGGAEPVLYNNALETLSGSGDSFVLSADIYLRAGGWNGIVFNYQDSGNFYELRLKGGATNYQVIQTVGGSTIGAFVNENAASAFAADSWYTFTVSSDTAYNYDFTITAQGSPTVLNAVTTGVDAGSYFTGGYGGFYASGPGGMDNFSLETVPEPSTLGLLFLTGGGLLFTRRRLKV